MDSLGFSRRGGRVLPCQNVSVLTRFYEFTIHCAIRPQGRDATPSPGRQAISLICHLMFSPIPKLRRSDTSSKMCVDRSRVSGFNCLGFFFFFFHFATAI